MSIKSLSGLLLLLFASTSFAWSGDYMAFGIASGVGNYKITNFSHSSDCWNFSGSSKTGIAPGGHIMCNVPHTDLGTFSLTFQRTDSNHTCTDTIATSKNQPYVHSSGGCPGVVIVDQDPHHKKFHYGDLEVNLQ